MNEYHIFFGMGVICGVLLTLQSAVMLAHRIIKKERAKG